MTPGGKTALWIGGIGLITAVIALLTTVIEMGSKLNEQEDRFEILVRERQEEVRAAEEKARIEAEAEAAKREAEAAAEQKRMACEGHNNILSTAEQEFSTLQGRRGVLLNFVKQCAKEPNEEQRGQCVAIVCASDWLLNSSGENCVSTLTEAGALFDKIKRTRDLALADGCQLGGSSALTFADDL